tara:strand:- start:335 stop:577 length:243 start_codon:yes stop_codon:yes gene_type:complete
MLQSHYSLFDTFFAPTRVIVVSEERLRQAEQEARQNQLDAIDCRIGELSKYRNSLAEEIKALAPKKPGADMDALDGVNDV